MNYQKVRIADLKPTDLPREETMKYYSSIDYFTMKLKYIPQVWDLGNGQLYISDGNNSAIYQARMGEKEIFVRIQDGKDNPFFGVWIDELIENMEILRENGIHTIQDLLPLVRWTECGFYRQDREQQMKIA